MNSSVGMAPNYLLCQPQLNATVTRAENKKTRFVINDKDENFELTLAELAELINNKEITISYSPDFGDSDDAITIEITDGPILDLSLDADDEKLESNLDIIFETISSAEPLRIKNQNQKYSTAIAPDFRASLFFRKIQEYFQSQQSSDSLRKLFLPPLPNNKFSVTASQNEVNTLSN